MKPVRIPSIAHTVSLIFETEFQAKKVTTIIERNIDHDHICPFLSDITPIFSLLRDGKSVTFTSGVYGTFYESVYRIYKFTGESPLVSVERAMDYQNGDGNFVHIWQWDTVGSCRALPRLNNYLEFNRDFGNCYDDVILDIYERFLSEAQAYVNDLTETPTV